MSKSIAEAITYALMKEQVYVPETHKTVTDAVKHTEYALAHGLPFKIAVAYGVSVITGRNNTKIPA